MTYSRPELFMLYLGTNIIQSGSCPQPLELIVRHGMLCWNLKNFAIQLGDL